MHIITIEKERQDIKTLRITKERKTKCMIALKYNFTKDYGYSFGCVAVEHLHLITIVSFHLAKSQSTYSDNLNVKLHQGDKSRGAN